VEILQLKNAIHILRLLDLELIFLQYLLNPLCEIGLKVFDRLPAFRRGRLFLFRLLEASDYVLARYPVCADEAASSACLGSDLLKFQALRQLNQNAITAEYGLMLRRAARTIRNKQLRLFGLEILQAVVVNDFLVIVNHLKVCEVQRFVKWVLAQGQLDCGHAVLIFIIIWMLHNDLEASLILVQHLFLVAVALEFARCRVVFLVNDQMVGFAAHDRSR
jgi:hypothetical protein